MAYNAMRIGMAGLGLNAAIQRQSRLYGPRPTAVYPVSKQQVQDSQIASLRKMIIMNKQQSSNVLLSNNPTFLASTSNQLFDYNLTNQFCTSTDYPKLVLGDRFVNKRIQLRVNVPSVTAISRLRIMLYWTKDPGTTYVPSGFQDIPDPASFTVVFDRTMFPSYTGHILGPVTSASVNLRNKNTTYNYSVPAIKGGELHLILFGDNTSGTATIVYTSSRLVLANK